jgi:hypothetical protein
MHEYGNGGLKWQELTIFATETWYKPNMPLIRPRQCILALAPLIGKEDVLFCGHISKW